jgi:hypothetical protein
VTADRGGVHAQPLGDLSLIQALGKVEQDELALGRWEFTEGSVQRAGVILFAHDLSRSPLRGLGDPVSLVIERDGGQETRGALRPLFPVEGQVPRDPRDPGSEMKRRSQLTEMEIDAEKDLLRQVLRRLGVSQVRHRNGVDQGGVALDERLEGGDIAPQGCSHQWLVG